jgi:tuftelin-interacting protein 11
MIVKTFQGWEPLRQPLHGRDVILRWKGLLQREDAIDFSIFPDVNSYGNSPGDSPYAQLTMEAIFPSVRYVATNIWEPRDPEPMIKFLEVWENTLPKSVLNTILEHVILPKLTMAVDCWDPRQETVAIHEWLHPWLPYLGQRLEPLYHPIRYKLGDALRAWHPSDRSAYLLLSPWQPVFDPASWEQLLVRSIIPKLIGALQELVINPQSQQLQPFHWVMEWAAAIPIHHMAAMLEAVFFPKWHQVLYHWLCSSPDLVEVTEWYLGWKSQLTDDLRANERIRAQLQIALDMMDKALQGMAVVPPGARENVSYLRTNERRRFESQQQAGLYGQRNASVYGNNGSMLSENGMGAPEMSLKEIVESEAEKNDVTFLPKVGRMHEGLQVYGFGSVSICMDNAQQRMYAQTGERWIPVSIDQVLEMHRTLSQQPSRWK